MLFCHTVTQDPTPSNDENRQHAVLQMVRERTTASITEIAERFHVSEMTIRRDIQKLVEAGQVIRVPGGARIDRAFTAERDFLDRLQRMSSAKQAIGRAAAALISDGETITLDSGTTTLNIARCLRERQGITVFTFSLAVIEELGGCDSVRVELTGGVYRRSSQDLVGAAVTQALSSVFASKVFFGAAALSFRKGVMVHDTEAPRALLDAGQERVLVIDSSKIGCEATYAFCQLDQCSRIITDASIRPDDLARLRDITEVIVAE